MKYSFSHEIKKELVKLPISKYSLEEFYSIMIFNENIFKNDLSVTSENKFIIERLKKLFDYNSKKFDIKTLNSYDIINNGAFKQIKKQLTTHDKMDLDPELSGAILRGAFLASGNISNPKSCYHLEFNVPSKHQCDLLLNIFNNVTTITFPVKITVRRDNYLIYLKDSEKIIDFVTFIGAQQAAMQFIQIKMLKEVRNNINRTTNFETANLNKTTTSSLTQIEAIKKIKNTVGIESLPYNLQETAKLRLQHPYKSLKDLAALHKTTVTKSGVNHRIKKIILISQNL